MKELLNFVVAHPWHFYVIFSILCLTAIYCCDRLSPYKDDDKDDNQPP